ncbi:MAG: hypothetical protein HLUCCA08_01530 [Rhodobacteraceae bacterium HLUCCA08]|nr:MAG: hypothetical protein HLUCCA08_01530 [Rhodobacteraceae bacterium HLUCCA08]
MRRGGLLVPLALVACTPQPVDPERAAQRCEERARAAAGPTGEVRLGANSEDGPFAGVSIGISSDYLAGRDPMAVYEQCVYDLTGAAPIRPPRL